LQSTQYSLESIRNDYPVLERKVRDNKALVYLDNAATTQNQFKLSMQLLIITKTITPIYIGQYML